MGTTTRQDMTAAEEQVLEVLNSEGGPLDIISISSRSRLTVEQVLRVVDQLERKNLIEKQAPEPVHERFTPSGSLQPH